MKCPKYGLGEDEAPDGFRFDYQYAWCPSCGHHVQDNDDSFEYPAEDGGNGEDQ